jgi:alkanesulfonate monooxygenase SsuD/methylene tetrahydromethanopterin reductase-like flavin-dependent oxidoreductase (luciferase family)
MKHFIVPCFVVVAAETAAVADELAANFQQNNCHGATLLLDEELSTTEIPTPTDDLPHTIVEIMSVGDADKIAEKIYNVLGSRRFSEWYKDDGEFGCHVMGNEFAATGAVPTKGQILERIKKDFLP